jgi:hypothetical protein
MCRWPPYSDRLAKNSIKSMTEAAKCEISIPKDNTGKLGRGIDFLGDGAYVVLPPSVISEGAGYGWHDSNR